MPCTRNGGARQLRISMDTLVGFSLTSWLKLLAENRFAVDWHYRERWLFVTQLALWNSIGRRLEHRRYGSRVAATRVEAPVFILGHWRSGTTLLHNLLINDPQFAYPNLFQTTHPLTMLVREEMIENALGNAAAHGRPMDNVQITFRSPGEDEAALAVLSLRSPLIGWLFPQREAHYDRYLTFRDAPEADRQRWEDALLLFMRKLTLRHGKRLLLKSPQHTARVQYLLRLFPDARFIHIRRDPYTVFRSTQRLFARAVPQAYLQQPSPGGHDEGILRRYQAMYEAFFEDRDLIPAGHYVEVAYEEVEQDMVGQVARIYETLSLPGFAEMRPALQQYVDSVSGYQKNIHEDLPDPLRRHVAEAAARCFEAWGYRP